MMDGNLLQTPQRSFNLKGCVTVKLAVKQIGYFSFDQAYNGQ